MSYLYSCHFPKSAVAPRHGFKGLKPPRHCIQQLPHQTTSTPRKQSWIKLLCHLFCIKSKGHSFPEMPSAYNLKPGQDYADLLSAQTLGRQALIRGGGGGSEGLQVTGWSMQSKTRWPGHDLPFNLFDWIFDSTCIFLSTSYQLEFLWKWGRAEWGNRIGRKRDTKKERDTDRNRGRAISSSQKPLRRQCTTTWILLQQPLAGFCLLATGGEW